MRNITDLSKEETLLLDLAKSKLREAALEYSIRPNEGQEERLFNYARRFSEVIQKLDLDRYWYWEHEVALVPPQR